MNRLLQAAAALVCAAGLSAFASTSNVTATLTDSDGTAWANCAWSAVVSSPTPPTISGVPVPDAQLRANGSCNGSGTLSATMLDTSSVDQRGVTWTFTITPNASVQPSVVSGVAVSGASVNLSTNLSSGIKAPRFNPGPKAYGYADAEVNAPTLGDTYFNTAGVCGSASLRQYSNAGWQCGGSAGSVFPSTNGLVYSTSPNSARTATAGDVSSLLVGANGITVAGDSIACATGATSTAKGYAFLLANAVGGVYTQYCRSGDTEADQNYQHVFPGTNPVGGGKDPLYISETGTNDSTQYGADANKQNIFQRLKLGSMSWLSVPRANKIFAQAATTTGTCTNDNSVQNLVGKSCSSSGAKITFNVTTTASNQAVYVWYLISDGSTGAFNISLDATNQTDPLNGSTTFSSAGDGGALIATTNGTKAGIAGFRVVVPTAGSHAVAVTLTAAASVSVFAVGVSPSAASPLNPTVIAVSPNHQNSANDAISGTYAGFVQGIVTTLAGDHLNVLYADTRTALGTNYATYYSDTIHPNDAGHALMESTIQATAPQSLITNNQVSNVTQVATTYSTSDSVDPSQYWTPNPVNILLPYGWGRGIDWYQFAGTHFFTAYLANTGITTGFPNNGSVTDWCVYGYSSNVNGTGSQFPGAPPASTSCYLALSGNGLLTIRSQVGLTGAITQTAVNGNNPGATFSNNAAENPGAETVVVKNIFTAGSSATGYISPTGKEFAAGIGAASETTWGVANKYFVRDVTNGVNVLSYDPSSTTTNFPGSVSASTFLNSGSVNGSARTVSSASDTATATDFLILCNAGSNTVAETLPSNPPTGQIIIFKKIDSSSNPCTLQGGGRQIDAGTTTSISSQWGISRVVYTTNAWYTF